MSMYTALYVCHKRETEHVCINDAGQAGNPKSRGGGGGGGGAGQYYLRTWETADDDDDDGVCVCVYC
jgi:hypothetical protein